MSALASFRRRVRRLVGPANGKRKGTKHREIQEELDDAEIRLWNKVEAARLAMQHLRLIGDQEQNRGGVEKVFFLPMVAMSVEEWERQVAERRATDGRMLRLAPSG